MINDRSILDVRLWAMSYFLMSHRVLFNTISTRVFGLCILFNTLPRVSSFLICWVFLCVYVCAFFGNLLDKTSTLFSSLNDTSSKSSIVRIWLCTAFHCIYHTHRQSQHRMEDGMSLIMCVCKPQRETLLLVCLCGACFVSIRYINCLELLSYQRSLKMNSFFCPHCLPPPDGCGSFLSDRTSTLPYCTYI